MDPSTMYLTAFLIIGGIIFLVLFTVMLIAEVGIMLKAIRKGPETETHTPSHNS